MPLGLISARRFLVLFGQQYEFGMGQIIVPVPFVRVYKAPEKAKTKAGSGEERSTAAQYGQRDRRCVAVKIDQLDAPGLHAQGLTALYPEEGKKCNDTGQRQNLGLPWPQGVVFGYADFSQNTQYGTVHHEYQCDNQQRIVEHGCQSSKQ